MGKFYEVKLTTVQFIVVEANDDENEEDATMYARSEYALSNGITETECVLLESKNVESAIRHSDGVMYI